MASQRDIAYRPQQKPKGKQAQASPGREVAFYEADVVPGLETVAYQELQQSLGTQLRFCHNLEEGSGGRTLQFYYAGAPSALIRLRTVLAVYAVCSFDIARPKALLGHANFQQLVEKIILVRRLSPAHAFATLYVDAAGANSSVMMRLKQELATHLGLRVDPDDGDLVLRIRRAQGGKQGWEVLVRLSPRPLSVRSWRTCHRAGGLNAAVAHAMVLLTEPTPEDKFLNLACGSGTLLIERCIHRHATRVLGCDIDAAAIDCARINVEASGYGEQIELFQWDAQALPLPTESVDVIGADLPFGKSIGSHQQNIALYPKILQESARVAKSGARVCLLTHEVQLMDRLLSSSQEWAIVQVLTLTVGGLHPRVYLLRRLGR